MSSNKSATTKRTAKIASVNALKSSTTKKISFASLNKWNFGLALLHAAQGVAVIILSKSVSFPVNTHFLTKDELASQAAGHPVLAVAVRHLFDVNLAYMVAAFFFMSAIAHITIATLYRQNYESDLGKGINKARWIEYALSASTMIAAIGLLSGVYDISTLLAIFGLTAVMNLCGLVMEVHNQTTKKTSWISYIVGATAGIMPWAVIAIYLKGAAVYGTGKIPTFVYWIYGTMFVLFFSFALNMYLQYRKKGKWSDYLYGERMYMILSLVAKTALAWQVFFGSLRP